MAMFPKSLDWAPFGRLTGEGRSRCWEGELNLGAWGDQVWLRVHGSPDGPSAAQHQALSAVVAQSDALKAQAGVAMVEFLRECEQTGEMQWLPPDFSSSQDLWAQLKPGFSEMGSAACERDLFLGFDLGWLDTPACAPSLCLHFLDGQLIEVSSGI